MSIYVDAHFQNLPESTRPGHSSQLLCFQRLLSRGHDVSAIGLGGRVWNLNGPQRPGRLYDFSTDDTDDEGIGTGETCHVAVIQS
jgi:hypothetical protein